MDTKKPTPADKTVPDRGQWNNRTEFFLSLVGLAVGIGNVWRFPYVCYKNGGGAFLIPYIIVLFLCGKPLFFMELAMGQYCSLGPWTLFKRICPIARGIGVAIFVFNLIVCIYYNVILSYTVYYLYATLHSIVKKAPLPWSWCDPAWADESCFDRVNSNLTNYYANSTAGYPRTFNTSLLKPQASPEQYFEKGVLQKIVNGTEYSIENVGGIVWELSVCMFVCWAFVCLGLIKGIQSAGKVVYVTATLPYIILFVLMVRGAMLEGVKEGMIFLFTPDWKKLGEIGTWRSAASQCLYTISVASGSLPSFGSYNPFRRRVFKDAMIVCSLDLLASLMACVVIFAVLGNLSLELNVPIESVAKGGQGLAFAAYPEALLQLPLPQLWSVLFFIMLFTLGIDSQFGSVEPMLTSLFDEFPGQRKYKALWTIGLCSVCFLLALPCVTHGGLYVVDIMDTYGGGISVMFIAICEAIAVFWIYGVSRVTRDFKFMMGYTASWYMKICWLVTTPGLIAFIFVFSLINYKPFSATGTYPPWADGIGWSLALLAMIQVPIWGIITVSRQSPNSLLQKLKASMQPLPEWGPADEHDRQLRDEYENEVLVANIKEKPRTRLTAIRHWFSQFLQTTPKPTSVFVNPSFVKY